MNRGKSIRASLIANYLNKKLIGADLDIKEPKSISELSGNAISFLQEEYFNSSIENIINQNTNSLVICSSNIKRRLKASVIISKTPAFDFSKIIKKFFKCPKPKITIGKNFFKRKYAVIGGIGFGFRKNDQGVQKRLTHIGGVTIGDNVEIGSFSTIDRGVLSNTIIGSDVKIDSHVHIAHNVIIGDGTLITAGVIVGGSAVIGKKCFIGINSSIRDHVKIGNNVFVGMGSVVVSDIPSNVTIIGNPARILKKNI
ncbi:hypothetical protein C4559_02065 [Candidatus Microgenomates bacterium]|nr:MAG: hypothetical protein C4559_02065 [Candidatus Microgenomates bacterium]